MKFFWELAEWTEISLYCFIPRVQAASLDVVLENTSVDLSAPRK